MVPPHALVMFSSFPVNKQRSPVRASPRYPAVKVFRPSSTEESLLLASSRCLLKHPRSATMAARGWKSWLALMQAICTPYFTVYLLGASGNVKAVFTTSAQPRRRGRTEPADMVGLPCSHQIRRYYPTIRRSRTLVPRLLTTFEL